MKKIFAIAVAIILCLACLCSCNNTENSKEETYGEKFTAGTDINTKGHKLHHIEITVKNYGIITLTLDETIAPITVQNFLKLANEGFYDGLTLHRIIDGFMIQGGDPDGDGTGGSPNKIKGEFAANGFSNPIPHVRGVISMARANAYNSASSQFFIMHDDAPHLNGNYAAFGWVTSGIEFVDAICKETQVEDKNGTVLKKNQPIILSVRVVGSEGGEDERVPGNETYGEAFTANIGLDTTGHTLHKVELTVEKYGIITLTLDETIAPVTVQNFLKLANEGYYDGLTFHRIIEGIIMQGGAGASVDSIKGEFADNGFDNPLPHVRGVISMARRTSPYDSATSQFFIMHGDYSDFDGSYAAFGWVTSGMEFVDAICEEAIIMDNSGTVPMANRPVILSVRVVTE